MDQPIHAVADLLCATRQGDRTALDRLLPIVYAQLRAVAARTLRCEDSPHALRPLALLSETYLQLVGPAESRWQTRAHFCGVAAHLVRRVLVEHAKRRTGDLTGRAPSVAEITLVEEDGRRVEIDLDVVALDRALQALAGVDARLARIVELRYFGALSLPGLVEVLDAEDGRMEREWRAARAWLHRYFIRS